MIKFKKAERKNLKVKLALAGPAGSGKTYSSLLVAHHLTDPAQPKVAVIDTEHGSSQKYVGVKHDAITWDFIVGVADQDQSPDEIRQTLMRIQDRVDVVIIDSLSAAWEGNNGVLEQAQRKQEFTKNNFAAWAEPKAANKKLFDAIIAAPCHVICTLRAKTAYEIVETETGKKKPQRIGLSPIQDEKFEYVFDVFVMMNKDNSFSVEKTRCESLNRMTGGKITKENFVDHLLEWINKEEEENEEKEESENE
ncbi:MAG: hypothetical protein D6816_04815 [Bacteroidetes bacterium]|nr:MAG: hypothetical protein D6816_04815 [Bacteroidota bacterium]